MCNINTYSDKAPYIPVAVTLYTKPSTTTGTGNPNVTVADANKKVYRILRILYSYGGTTNWTYIIPGVELLASKTWSHQTQFNVHPVSDNAPFIQVVAENVTIKWTGSTSKLEVVRGSYMYYGSINATGCNGGRNSTAIVITGIDAWI